MKHALLRVYGSRHISVAGGILLALALGLSGCQGMGVSSDSSQVSVATRVPGSSAGQLGEGMPSMGSGMGAGMGGGMGAQNGMMERHHAPIPGEYASLENPVEPTEASIVRGAEIYAANCATCHGDGGMGDGPAGAAFDPSPAPIARTSQMMSDAYLFWRVSEGGASFKTAMPAWKTILDEASRWDVLNYVRALGSGQAKPSSQMGGAMYDPAAQAQRQAEVLAEAVNTGVITQAEADLFARVHDALEVYRAAHPELRTQYPDATAREAAMLAALVADQRVSQADADAFTGVHDRLGAAGLMP